MSEPLNIVMISAEATPYAKVGGLADVAGVLPRVLEKSGARLTLLLPAYQAVDREKHGLRPDESLSRWKVRLGSSEVPVEVLRTQMPGTGVEVFFLGGGGFFDRPGIYDDPATKDAFPDNMQRFVFLVKAALEWIRRKGAPP
ncbi:MAG: hypothetical protein FJW35_17880, partial [Acidobacteria bacterium]|nr:hypothetical protein [Acidobacteriota bacterium]